MSVGIYSEDRLWDAENKTSLWSSDKTYTRQGSHANPVPSADGNQDSQWHGWSSIRKMFVFGDSYTTTGFNATTGPQPNASNPLGNPRYPGYTSSNGPNWVDYLTVKYNGSLIETYNLAYGGATVDSALVRPYLPTVLSLKQQIQDEFIPLYAHNESASWSASSTLFAIWIGINDIGNSYANANGSTLLPQILAEYSSLVTDLYDAGARQFLFLNVPPVDRSPLTTAQGSAAAALEASTISRFNAGIQSLAHQLQQTSHHDDHQEDGSAAAVFTFDAHALFESVLDDPAQFPQTAGYKNTTAYCAAYANGTPATDSFNATCGIPVNQYFWLNSLHPTYPMHDLLAAEVAEMLRR